MHTSRITLAAGIAAGLLIAQGVLAQAETTMNATQCLAADNVWVVVERETGLQDGGCATTFTTGLEALRSAGFTVEGDDFVQSINAHPATPSPDHYWSYWNGATQGDGSITWSFAQVGAATSSPEPGTVEGWHFVNWQKGTATPPNWQPPVEEPEPTSPPKISTPVTGVLGDHTGDRLADVFAVDGSGRMQVFAGSSVSGEPGPLKHLGQVGTGWNGMDYIAQVADVDGDRRSDLLARRTSDNSLWLYRGTGNGYLSGWKQVGNNWGGMDQIVPAGNLAGGSTQYVVARRASDGALFRYTLSGRGLTDIKQIGRYWNGMRQMLSVGDFTGDGRGDVLAVRDDGTLWMYAGTTQATIAAGKQVGQGWGGFERAFSAGDLSGDGRPDLLGQRSDGKVFAYKNLVGTWGQAREVLSGAEGYVLMA